uniref:Exportin-7/Ran-binding protein 17 TPR repeats domain-containing protein n=1 Tax=Ditylenchus dipsaci TaxID=166011 RepID=A0A915EP95_9BILA
MASSLSYARVDVESIAESVPQVCAALIQSMILLCELVVRECVEDPLDDVGTLKQLMELFTIVSRRDYKRTAQELISLTQQDLLVARKRLIWIITMMAAGVNGKTVCNSCDADDDIFDGEVVSRSLFLLTEVLCSLDEPEKENMALDGDNFSCLIFSLVKAESTDFSTFTTAGSRYIDSTLKSDKEVSQEDYRGRNFKTQVVLPSAMVFEIPARKRSIIIQLLLIFPLCWIAALIFFNAPLKLNEEEVEKEGGEASAAVTFFPSDSFQIRGDPTQVGDTGKLCTLKKISCLLKRNSNTTLNFETMLSTNASDLISVHRNLPVTSDEECKRPTQMICPILRWSLACPIRPGLYC